MTQTPEVAVAMDWGGTWARAAVVDRGGNFQWQSRVANAAGASKDQLLEVAGNLLTEAIEQSGSRWLAGVGVAVAGPVDSETGTLFDPPNLPLLDGVSLKALWEPTLGCPVLVGNDANLAALGEYQFGAGRVSREQPVPPRTLVYMTVSTGIGGGVVDRGQMFLGANGLAAEIGHMSIDNGDSAPACSCGSRGCLESLASGTAIARIAAERVTGEDSRILEHAGGKVKAITSQVVFDAAAQGDGLANAILDGVVFALAVGLTNVLHLYNPDLVVLGGGVTNGLIQLDLLPRIQALMMERAMSKRHRDFRLVPSQLGDAVGLAGAAALVWQESGGPMSVKS